jgi:hypothetical protein
VHRDDTRGVDSSSQQPVTPIGAERAKTMTTTTATRSTSASTLHALLDLARGEDLDAGNSGPARRVQLCIVGALASLGLAAVFGIAVGSTDVMLAAGNVLKVPMVLLLSVLSSLPAALVAQKLLTLPGTGRSVVESVAAGKFASGLVLFVLAPLVAIYYHTSAWAGPMLGIASVVAALAVGHLVFLRALMNRRPQASSRRSAAVPAVVFIVLQSLTLVQFISLASPMFPESTKFNGGIDTLIQR